MNGWWIDARMYGWMDGLMNGLMDGLIQYVGMLKSKMYVNKVGMDNSKNKEKTNHFHTTLHI